MTSVRNIAIIAVHGVGEHEPHSSASAVSRLLLRLPRAFGSRYTSFAESPIAIPVEPVPEARTAEEVNDYRTRKDKQRLWTLDERPERKGFEDRLPAGIRFMRDQLHDYRASATGGTYETVRYEGRHLPKADTQGEESSSPDARLHVYEMYWSDLSRIGSSFFAIFGAFYQVIIHLPYLGLVTLEEAGKERHEGKRRLWAVWGETYRWALRLMTLVAPVLNIVMLALALSVLARLISADARRAVAVVLPGLVAAGLASWRMYRNAKARSLGGVALAMLLGAAIIVVGWMWRGPLAPTVALIVEAWLILAVPLYLLFRLFERNRPGARMLGTLTWGLTSVLLVLFAVRSNQNPTTMVIGTLEWLNVGLLATWFAFSVLLLGVVVLGWFATGSTDDTSADDRSAQAARRAAYTARFALAFPAVAFAIVTLTFWGALVAGESGRVFDRNERYESVFRYPALTQRQASDRRRITEKFASDSARFAALTASQSSRPGAQRFRDSIDLYRERTHDELNALSGPGYFLRVFGGSSEGLPGAIGVGLIGAALLIVAWMLVPVLATEFRSPTLDDSSRAKEDFAARSVRLGTWLTTAFRSARISGELLVIVTILALIAIYHMRPHLSPFTPSDAPSLAPVRFGYTEVGGWLVGASAVGIYALFTRLSSVGRKLRPVFGIMADVDNYLRELPGDRTPRAKIAARYTSLLRYLCRWRTENDPTKGYDAVVIVAHSQGTVITADLLRFLGYFKHQRSDFEPHLDRLKRSPSTADSPPPMPIIFLSMGCPLRQLYLQRFPHLYGWVEDPTAYLGSVNEAPTVGEQPLLGVTAWINLYRSGDYVGRFVTRPTGMEDGLYDPRRFRKHETIAYAEACIGPGAHTHYWDDSAEIVARALDAVVKNVIAGGTAGGPIAAAEVVIEQLATAGS